jgi:hypothetical protein
LSTGPAVVQPGPDASRQRICRYLFAADATHDRGIHVSTAGLPHQHSPPTARVMGPSGTGRSSRRALTGGSPTAADVRYQGLPARRLFDDAAQGSGQNVAHHGAEASEAERASRSTSRHCLSSRTARVAAWNTDAGLSRFDLRAVSLFLQLSRSVARTTLPVLVAVVARSAREYIPGSPAPQASRTGCNRRQAFRSYVRRATGRHSASATNKPAINTRVPTRRILSQALFGGCCSEARGRPPNLRGMGEDFSGIVGQGWFPIADHSAIITCVAFGTAPTWASLRTAKKNASPS